MTRHVLLITSSNLASNPRCLKEVQLLSSMNIKTSVVAFEFHNWTREKERMINNELKQVNFYYIDATKDNFLLWFFSTLIEKVCRSISSLFAGNIYLSTLAINKRSWLLLRWIKNWEEQPDLIIAHNPAAFYSAWVLSKKIKKPFAIDIEDYHPGEGNNKKEQKNVMRIMKFILPRASYVSYASPLIKKYTDNFLAEKKSYGFVINNCFPDNEFKSPLKQDQKEKLQLVWFSQYIDYGRGLEKVLPALDLFKDELTLTLIGDSRPYFYEKEIRHRNYIISKPTMPQKELHVSLNKFDVGLAIEEKSANLNRDICLTNKIWAYFQAGLYILASKTKSQELFINDHKEHGVCIILEKQWIEKQIDTILKNIDMIRSGSQQRFQNAKLYSWENESQPLRNSLNELLST